MPTRRYALETAGPERLGVTWGATIYSRCTIRLDGQVVASFPFRDLQGGKGKEIRLPDGSSLNLKQAPVLGWRFQILLNGKPLPGSISAVPAHPTVVVGGIVFLYAVGGIVGLVGIGAGLAILLGGIPTGNGTVLGLVTMILLLLIAAPFFVIARGLWRLQNWARLCMIGLLSLLLLGGIVFGLSNLEELGTRILRVGGLLVTVAYGIYWFAAHGNEFSPPGRKKTVRAKVTSKQRQPSESPAKPGTADAYGGSESV
jgi:hypothetical protein